MTGVAQLVSGRTGPVRPQSSPMLSGNTAFLSVGVVKAEIALYGVVGKHTLVADRPGLEF